MSKSKGPCSVLSDDAIVVPCAMSSTSFGAPMTRCTSAIPMTSTNALHGTVEARAHRSRLGEQPGRTVRGTVLHESAGRNRKAPPRPDVRLGGPIVGCGFRLPVIRALVERSRVNGKGETSVGCANMAMLINVAMLIGRYGEPWRPVSPNRRLVRPSSAC